jgi:hypothetical protein
MSLEESEMTLFPCTKCNGDGNVGIVRYNNRKYKILCPKCLGTKKLDWIQQTRVLKRQRDAIIIIIFIEKYILPDDYTFVYGGTAYFINKEFFGSVIINHGNSLRWNNILMNIPIVKKYPHLADAWSNKEQLWEEISFI